MTKPRSIKELLTGGGPRLAGLKQQTLQRTSTLEHVCAALPPELAKVVLSAGIDAGQLTIGVAGGTWAARLRYVTETLRIRVSTSMKVDIERIRIKVVPPRA